MIHSEAGYYKLMFQVLSSAYQAKDLGTRITEVLGIIGGYIDIDHICIFEDDFASGMGRGTYTWHASQSSAPAGGVQCVPLSEIAEWRAQLQEQGMAVARNIAMLPGPVFRALSERGICSAVLLPLYANHELFGCICFGERTRYRDWTQGETEVLRALTGLVSVLVARHNAEHQADASQRMLCTVLDNITTPIYVSDPETSRILFANQTFVEEFQCPDAEGRTCWQVLRPGQDNACPNCPRNRLLVQPVGATQTHEFRHALTGRWYLCTDRLIEWVDGNTAHLQTVLDITARKEYEARLMWSATYDPMTGVYNRESGLMLLSDMLRACALDAAPVTFCYLDVDGLKYVNDTYGHVEGDRLLTTIVEIIRCSVSSTDIFARLGGDEFMIALRGCTLDNACKVILRIKQRLEELTRSGGFSYGLSFSEGLYEIAPGSADVDTILKHADKNMYLSKQEKREQAATAGV